MVKKRVAIRVNCPRVFVTVPEWYCPNIICTDEELRHGSRPIGENQLNLQTSTYKVGREYFRFAVLRNCSSNQCLWAQQWYPGDSEGDWNCIASRRNFFFLFTDTGVTKYVRSKLEFKGTPAAAVHSAYIQTTLSFLRRNTHGRPERGVLYPECSIYKLRLACHLSTLKTESHFRQYEVSTPEPGINDRVISV